VSFSRDLPLSVVGRAAQGRAFATVQAVQLRQNERKLSVDKGFKVLLSTVPYVIPKTALELG